jgi:hypothetical protein
MPGRSQYRRAAMSRGRFEIALSFRQVACTCGGARICGQPCLDCGQKALPTEVDPDKQRRQRLARICRAVTHDVSPVAPLPESISDTMIWLLQEILGGALDLVSKADEGGRLADAIRQTVNLEATLRQCARFRPRIAVFGDLADSARELIGTAGAILDALEANNPIDATRAEERMQAAIDAAGHRAARAQKVEELWARLEESDEPLFVWLTEAARPIVNAPVSTRGLQDLDLYGAQLLRERLGCSCPTGFGVSVALINLLASTMLDQRQMWAIAAQELTELAQHPAELARLATDENWPKEWRRSAVEMWELGERARLLFPAARTDEARVRNWLDISHAMQEGPAKRFFATTQLVLGVPNDFPALLANGIGNLAEWMRSKGFIAGSAFMAPTRHAFAHNDFIVEADSITLTPLKPPSGIDPPVYAVDEFVDVILEGYEAVLGTWLGIVATLASLGIEIDAIDVSTFLSSEELLSMLLHAGGWDHADVHRQGTQIKLEASGDREPYLPELASYAVYLATDIEELDAVFDGPVGRVSWRCDLEPLRRFQEADTTEERDVLMVEVLAGTVADGEPMVTSGHIRKLLALSASRAAGVDDLRQASRQFKLIRATAERLGDERLVAEIKAAQAFNRNGIMGNSLDPSALDPLLEWAGAELSPLPSLRGGDSSLAGRRRA